MGFRNEGRWVESVPRLEGVLFVEKYLYSDYMF